MLCRKYKAPSTCVYKKSEKIKVTLKEIGICALCHAIIYTDDNFVISENILFCSQSCKIEAYENLQTDHMMNRVNDLEF
jgi:hypothetical protein